MMRFLMSEVEGNPDEFPYVAIQTHGNRIISSLELQKKRQIADGIYIGPHMPPGGIATADCLPLALLGDESALLLHISRKTLIEGILETARERMDFIIKKIIIGPHICANHLKYEKAGPEILKFQEMFPNAVQNKEGYYYLSLRDAIEPFLSLFNDVVINEDTRCTYEDKTLLSYRRALEQEKRVETQRLITSFHYIPDRNTSL